jgi:hypothetical protein
MTIAMIVVSLAATLHSRRQAVYRLDMKNSSSRSKYLWSGRCLDGKSGSESLGGAAQLAVVELWKERESYYDAAPGARFRVIGQGLQCVSRGDTLNP